MTARTSQLTRSMEHVRQLLQNPSADEVARAGLLGPLRSAPFLRHSLNDAGALSDAPLPSTGESVGDVGELGPAAPRLELRVAVLADETLTDHLRGLCEVISWDAEHRLDQQADLVVLSPAAAGAFPDGLPAGRLPAGVPAVFWDYGFEDPSEPALALARQADTVAAASEEQVRRYAELLGSERPAGAHSPGSPQVQLLSSAVNPLRHSPIGSRAAAGTAAAHTVTFADAWMPQRPDQAGDHLQWILDAVIEAELPLVLPADGSHPQGTEPQGTEPQGTDPLADLPVRHRPYVSSPRTPAETAAADRRADVGITLNPVADSQSAVAPRVLQMLASGTMVLASYNQGVNSYLPEVHLANSQQDVADTLRSLTLEEMRRVQADGLRKVFLEHHAAAQLRSLCRAAGVTVQELREPRVLAVTDEVTDALHEALSVRQTQPVQDLITWEQVRDYDQGSADRHYDVLLPVSAERHYSPSYVADHLAAFTYQSARITAKLDADAATADAQAHRHHEGFAALEVPLELTAWWKPTAPQLTAEALRAAAQSTRIYALDHLEHGRTEDRRPVGVEDAATARGPQDAGLELTVVVPVYNNGAHLRHKAFASLRRSSIFSRMHILLVDDGSTDPLTVATVEQLAAEWPNVTAYRHAPGGSGSASRPRNTGLELTETPYVTYLDPDNEMVEDGFARLLKELEEHPEIDFAVGGMTIWSTGLRMQDYHQVLMDAFADCVDSSGTIEVPEDALVRLRFRPFGIQTLAARTGWLQSLGLVQPVGAVGQDTYFFQQMLHYAHTIRTVATPIHTYYAVVSNSTVNTINARYFDKYRALDEARSQWLREVGLLETYNETRLERFTEQWHLPKLRRVPDDQWLEAAENLAALLNCYGPRTWKSTRIQDFFAQLEAARRKR